MVGVIAHHLKEGGCMKDTCNKGKKIREWETGDTECNAYSEEYECGAVYNNNYMDIIGCRDHDCFWDCRGCNRGCSEEVRKGQ